MSPIRLYLAFWEMVISQIRVSFTRLINIYAEEVSTSEKIRMQRTKCFTTSQVGISSKTESLIKELFQLQLPWE